jgi:hypothetical protein
MPEPLSHRKRLRLAPFSGVPNHFQSFSGGLRYAPTTGYYLAAFQAEDVLNLLRNLLIIF